ncbi:hypothetical protein D3C84_778430 [compost metagenome]
MQHAGVRCIALLLHALQGPFEYGHRLKGVGTCCRLAGFQVPQLPGRAVDQRFGEQCHHVGIVGKAAIDIAHGRRIGIVPGEKLVNAARLFGLVALLYRVDQGLFHWCRAVKVHQRDLCRQSCLGHGLLELLLDEGVPAFVVVGPRGIGDAPVGHRAVAIVFQGFLETADGFVMVVAVAPHQAAVEPKLGLG